MIDVRGINGVCVCATCAIDRSITVSCGRVTCYHRHNTRNRIHPQRLHPLHSGSNHSALPPMLDRDSCTSTHSRGI